ncbi:Spindle assembly abnormal protein 6 [Coelomomyces lativittatus]|nr:Spindle assembly abnormal protein 6 [Coelomomyces lativittatus]
MSDSSNSLPLWTGVVPLSVRTQERTNAIQAKFTLRLRREPPKKFDICITQDPDSFFLYTLSLSEDDFHTLKAEQGLVVDFNVFPDKLIELLSSCQNVSKSKFIAQLLVEQNNRPAILNIIETNTFKQIIHLALNMVPGDDATIKKYLAGLVSLLKDELHNTKESMSKSSTNYKEQISTLESGMIGLRKEIENIRSAHSEELRNLSMKHSETLSKERELFLNDKDKERQVLEHKRRDHEATLNDEIKILTIKATTLQTSLDQIVQHKQTLDAQYESLKQRHGILSSDHTTLQSKHQTLLSEKSQLEKDLHCCKVDLQRQLTQLNALEANEKALLDQKNKLERDLARDSEKQQGLQTELDQVRGQLHQVEAGLKEAHLELHKANEIICKLQVELKAVKSKWKLKSSLNAQQEKMIKEKSQDLKDKVQELQSVRQELQQYQQTLATKSEDLNQAKKDLEAAHHLNEERQQLIDWLHNQLNEEVVATQAPVSPTGSHRITSPFHSNIAKKLLPTSTSPISTFSPSHRFTPTMPFSTSCPGPTKVLATSTLPISTARKRSHFF